MSEFQTFAKAAREGDAKGAIKYWASNSGAILADYRAARDADDGDAWWDGDYALLEKLIYEKIGTGDLQAASTISDFISAGVLLNEVDRDGHTMVGLLAMVGHLELIKVAVGKGADVNLGDENALAIFGTKELPSNWLEIAEFLIGAGCSVNGRADQQPALFGAIRRNHYDAINFLAKNGANPNRIYEPRNQSRRGTAMHYSLITALTHDTSVETGRLLIKLGGDPTIRNRDGLGAIDAFYALDREANESARCLVELYSSTDDWRKASWYLTDNGPTKYNPARRGRAKDHNQEKTWNEIPGNEITFRIGDRVEVIRRAGLFGNRLSLTLMASPNGREPDLEMRAMPGATGIIVGWDPNFGNQWKAIIEFEPGTWEEVDNYGHLRDFGRCRGSLFPDALMIKTVEDEYSGSGSKPSQSQMSSAAVHSDRIADLAKHWKILASIGAAVILILLFF